MGLLLEVIVQTVEDAREAARGGADRLEVVRAIEEGGLTPRIELVRAIAQEVDLPLRVMVRSNSGYTAEPGELERLRHAAAQLQDVFIDGIVVGFADGGRLRLDQVEHVLSGAPGIRATFHRAFDTVDDPLTAIDEIGRVLQIDRVLTSGGRGPAEERSRALAALSQRANDRLTIIAGGGVDENALATFARTRCVAEVHVGRAARPGSDPHGPVRAPLVRRLRELSESGDQ